MPLCIFHSKILSAVLVLLQLTCVLYASPLSPSLSGGQVSMPAVESVEVKCGRSGMSVHVTFDRPFPGVIYSKGHYYEPSCNYVTSKNTGEKEFSFLIPVDACGTNGKMTVQAPEDEMYYQNVIIIQNDPLIQEVWDEARQLKCVWKNTFTKAVRSNPITIENPDLVNVAFDSRSFNSLMQIQKGNAPFSAPALGYIYVGDDTSLVIYLKDSSGTLDANAVSCVASSSKGSPVELVDRNGCVVRPSLMSPFAKIKHPKNVEADLMIYSFFKAFRVGDDPNFKISCQLEVCEGSCLEPCALGPYSEETGSKRSKRESGTTAANPKRNVIQVEHAVIVLRKGKMIDMTEPKTIASTACENVLLSSRDLLLFALFQIFTLIIVMSVCLRCFFGVQPNFIGENGTEKKDLKVFHAMVSKPESIVDKKEKGRN